MPGSPCWCPCHSDVAVGVPLSAAPGGRRTPDGRWRRGGLGRGWCRGPAAGPGGAGAPRDAAGGGGRGTGGRWPPLLHLAGSLRGGDRTWSPKGPSEEEAAQAEQQRLQGGEAGDEGPGPGPGLRLGRDRPLQVLRGLLPVLQDQLRPGPEGAGGQRLAAPPHRPQSQQPPVLPARPLRAGLLHGRSDHLEDHPVAVGRQLHVHGLKKPTTDTRDQETGTAVPSDRTGRGPEAQRRLRGGRWDACRRPLARIPVACFRFEKVEVWARNEKPEGPVVRGPVWDPLLTRAVFTHERDQTWVRAEGRDPTLTRTSGGQRTDAAFRWIQTRKTEKDFYSSSQRSSSLFSHKNRHYSIKPTFR
ncbi:unnamed protein product [Tetraodon nigroviridis]|uniref:(spotted green pufferfish) hypothetical protein n=1 Tax=Tetraodon nigroviridis TaxID=99883 RepID=Q4SSJ1_TETNG|nr:unnamed protein product [Tetraodon nigroviridis]